MGKPILDCQDEFDGALRAMAALRDLCLEAQGPDKRSFEVVGPDGLGELLVMVTERMERAQSLLDKTAAEIFGR